MNYFISVIPYNITTLHTVPHREVSVSKHLTRSHHHKFIASLKGLRRKGEWRRPNLVTANYH